MIVDSHVHLQPHGEKPPITLERLEMYVESAKAQGIECIAITEHLFRFQEAFDLLYGWWEADTVNPMLCKAAREYWQDHVSCSIADYVRVVEEAKSGGLPVLLGLELDWIPGHIDQLRRFVEPYAWDVVLGSVHYIGSWGFDVLPHPVFEVEWQRRDIDATFAQYAALLRDLALSGLCQVLAHSDLPKIAGYAPTSFEPLHKAIVGAAVETGCAIEVNSSGYNSTAGEAYPAPTVLQRAQRAGVSITLGSDAHRSEHVGRRFDDLVGLALRAGYREYVSFENRHPILHRLQQKGPS